MRQYLSAFGCLQSLPTEGVTYHRTTCPDCDFESHNCERAIDAENEYHEHKCAAEERGRLERLLAERGLAHAKDDQLRAECERRAMVPDAGFRLMGKSASHCVHGQRVDGDCFMCRIVNNAAAERDEWKRRAESAIDPEALRKWGLNPDAVREYESHADAMRAMGFERDVGMWWARAEAAEAKLVLFEAGNTFAGRQMTVDEDAFRKLRANLRERGPGIAATKPDNSVAFLDEDLLCEDA